MTSNNQRRLLLLLKLLERDLSRGISPYTNEIDTPYFYDILYYN